ncbi:outer membrane immunogenic protein [Rhodovulum imhoffii]|uniref:Outer membrane immunogenic protein n=1 Tax=Rhodovulum imhoffii TaxID=365340 RepID=A0A2T5BU05_9RHOB|nr:outer membrane beta-barrel protein [Rhodovulum imhoffii]MBK5932752.1 hypothetical protein [Rhodovulum imhoffii]PTN02959.1 outer membrane immunogenic protein [Rhodovulum imhoffii]
MIHPKMPSVCAALCCTAVVAGAPVFAGGLAPNVEEPEIISAAPIAFTIFEGVYAGASLGFAFGGDDRVGLRDPVPKYNAGKLELGGVLGDLHLGYRWRNYNLVYGGELGVSFGNVEDSTTDKGVKSESSLNTAITLRGSVGQMVRDDTLLYGFAGLSRGSFDYSVKGTDAGGDIGIDDDFDRTGYVLGVGMERAMSERWSVRGELQYSNYGKEKLTGPNDHATYATPDYFSLNLGVNFQF